MILTAKEQNDMETAFKAFMKNPAWKAEYEDAPSEAVRDFQRYIYYSSKFREPEVNEARFAELQEYYYGQLSLDDWKYLRAANIGSPFSGYCNRRIEQLEKEQNTSKGERL